MVTITQHDTKTEKRIYEVLETMSMVLTEIRQLHDLLFNSNDNIHNEIDESVNRLCFNC